MGNELTTEAFNYEMVDNEIADFLREKETNIMVAFEDMINFAGKELKEAQDKLSSHDKYKGIFEKWYTAIGFTKRTVYNYIDYHSVVQQVHKMDIGLNVDRLPKKLIYAIGSKSSESTPAKTQAKEEVLLGNIDTLKEYQMRIKELELANSQKEEYEKLLEEENSRLSSQLQQERNKPQQVKTEVVERVVEVDKTDYTQLQQLQRDAESYKRKFESAERMKELLETRLKQEEADADAHRKLKDEIESLQSQKGDMYRQMESAKILGEFQAKVEAFLLEELAPKVYSKFREEIGESQVLSESFLETLDKIDEWLKDMRYAVSNGKSVKNMGEIIEAEVIKYE